MVILKSMTFLLLGLGIGLTSFQALAESPEREPAAMDDGTGGSTDEISNIEAELYRHQPEKMAPDIQESPNLGSSTASGNITDLGRWAPFSDIAIIQKRFLPKTNRFQGSLGVSYLTNNPFIQSVSMHGRMAYYLSESLGVEVTYMSSSTTSKPVTVDLHDLQNVKTDSLVGSKNYLGADIVFIPYYGKITWINERIVPFDFYFSGGIGSVTTTYKDSKSPAIHLGTGQIFALTKMTVFRWDFTVTNFNAEIPQMAAAGTATKSEKKNFTDLYLGVSLGWFFPGAKYR